MPVRKFRRIEEMTPPPARTAGPALDRAIAFVLNTAARMTPLQEILMARVPFLHIDH